MNKVQELINELVEKYNIRSFIINGEQWFAINDLPISTRTLERYKNSIIQVDEEYYNTNIKLFKAGNFSYVKNDIPENGSTKPFINFDFNTLNNFGEMFVKFKLFNLIVNMSNLGLEYKIGISNIIEEIKKNDYYVDESISEENLNKLEERVKSLREFIQKGNGNFPPESYLSLDKIGEKWSKEKKVEITKEFLIALMTKAGWLNKKGEINSKARYGHKVVNGINGGIMLSPTAHDLLLNHLNKLNDKELLEWARKYNNEKLPF